MKNNRGGKSLKVGDIGRLSVLRQHLMLPGETLNASIKGNVRLSGLRQQTSVYLHAQIEAFAAPLRWYFSGFPDYLKEGIKTATTIPVLTGTDWTASPAKTSNLGIGRTTHDIAKWWAQHPINVWNEWYRWPEDAKVSVSSPPIAFFADQGKECVNLESALTRLHDAPSFDAATERDVPAVTVLDVRALADFQAKFHQAAVTDWTSQERYNAFMRDVYGAAGNNEVDQVPIRLKKGAELGVQPRDMYATDGASLGELMSINNFQVDHKWDSFQAKEHMIVCYVMVLRFAPIADTGVSPHAYPTVFDYETMQGDPAIMAAQPPVAVTIRELASGDGTAIGFLPHGWQWREGFNHVDEVVNDLQNFPLLNVATVTATGFRDASKILAAFRSTALRHWFGDLDFNCNIKSRIPPSGKSIVAGSGRSGPKGNHPTGGWVK